MCNKREAAAAEMGGKPCLEKSVGVGTFLSLQCKQVGVRRE